VQDWVNTLVAQGLAPATVRHCHRVVFKSVINTAVMDGLLAVSPCFRIEQPEPRQEKSDPLTPAQVEGIVERTAPRYRALVVLGAACGPRFCEAAGLSEQHEHVLAGPRLVRIERQLDRHNSCPAGTRSTPCPFALPPSCCGAVFAPPKSAAGVRDLPIPDLGMDAVDEHRRRFAPTPCGLLFTTPARP
jgi:integrase